MDQPSQVPQSHNLSPIGTTILQLNQKEKWTTQQHIRTTTKGIQNSQALERERNRR